MAAATRMIVGATLPSARVGEGLETTQLSRFVALPGWVCLGAEGRVPAAKAERPLSVQSRDLRGDAGQRARRADSGRSPSRVAAAKFDTDSGPSTRRAHRRRCVEAANPKMGFAQPSSAQVTRSQELSCRA